MAKEFKITSLRLADLEKELNYLKTTREREIAAMIAEARRIMEISRRRDNIPVRVTTSMHDLVARASTQNFVPVVDDKDTFIGIVPRSAIIKYCMGRLFPEA